jgi:hypothetical protein
VAASRSPRSTGRSSASRPTNLAAARE